MSLEYLLNTQQILFTVHHSLNCFDRLDWEGYKKCFAEGEIIYDYTSLNGGEPLQGSVDIFIDLVVQTLPGYKATLHQTTNPEIYIEGDSAIFHSSVIATHYLPNELTESDSWQAVGFYDIKLDKKHSKWKISKLKFTKTIVIGDCIGLRNLAKSLSHKNRNPRNTSTETYDYPEKGA